MTLSEFKAWLDGFSEAIQESAPTPNQWKTIQEKLETVEQPALTLPKITGPLYDPPQVLPIVTCG